MHYRKALTLSILVASLFNASQAFAQVSTITANYVRSVRTSGQPPTPVPHNLIVFFALETYFLTVNSSGKNVDGLVGINYPQRGSGKFPASASANFVNNFTNFRFFMTQPTQPSNGAYPFTVVVQDSDGNYHATNGDISATGQSLFRYRFDAPATGNWVPALDTTGNEPKVRKLALVFSGDFTTPVKSVFIPVTLEGPLSSRNPIIQSSRNANDIPGSNAVIHYATGSADTKFNFDTANN